MELLYSHLFTSLSAASAERCVVLGESWHSAKPLRERTAQLMFERFQVPALYVGTPASAAAASSLCPRPGLCAAPLCRCAAA
jgi:actin-related protein